MENIKFTATFSFNKNSIENFARARVEEGGLGYTDKISVRDVDENGLSLYTSHLEDNPESLLEYVSRLAKEHNEKFVTGWANNLVKVNLDNAVAQTISDVKPQLETAILNPVKEAIQVTYEQSQD